MLAIGFIETMGLLPAIEAADAMLKAADVRLLEKNLVGSGLVTITVAGEVSAVQASVDAAEASLKRIEGAILVSRHVIPRPDAEISRILTTSVSTEKAPEEQPPSSETEQPAVEEATVESVEESKSEENLPDKGQLKKMSLNRLRELASDLEGNPFASNTIASANKNTLIDMILTAYRQMKE